MARSSVSLRYGAVSPFGLSRRPAQRRAALFDFLLILPCHARAARRARGAERERALAGASGGASGPCRPSLKSYRKFSPARNGRNICLRLMGNTLASNDG